MVSGPSASCRRNNRKSYAFSLLTRHDPAIANTRRQRRGPPLFKSNRAVSITLAAVLGTVALLAAGCAHVASLPASGTVAGQRIETTLDSEAARYYLQHYLRNDRRHPALDAAFDRLPAPGTPTLPTHGELRELTRQYSADFAALYLAARLDAQPRNRQTQDVFRRELATVRRQLAAGSYRPHPGFADYVVLFVPGWDYRSSAVITGADFASPRALLNRVGVANRLVAIPSNGSVEENAARLAEELRQRAHEPKKLILVSASSAGPAVALALDGRPGAGESCQVRAWLNAGGLLQGTPLVERYHTWPVNWFARFFVWLQDWDWEAVESMAPARSRARFARLRLPPHLLTLNYIGIPLSGSVTPLARDNYYALRRQGPNDGLTLITDALAPDGATIAALGRDHYLAEDPELDLTTLALAQTLIVMLESRAPVSCP